jgi:hypothetical protein
MRVAEAGAHAPALAEASTALGVLCRASGQPAAAIAPLERAADLARQWSVAYLRAFSFSWLALGYAFCGRVHDAKVLLDDCEAQRVWEHVRLQWSRIVVRLGEARLHIGEPRRAARLAEHGLALATSIGEPVCEVEALMLKARLARRGDPTPRTSAPPHVGEAIALCDRLGLHALARRLRTGLAHTHRTPVRPRASAG